MLHPGGQELVIILGWVCQVEDAGYMQSCSGFMQGLQPKKGGSRGRGIPSLTLGWCDPESSSGGLRNVSH